MSSLPDAPTTPGTTETEKLLQLHGEKKLRFQMELEFVEMLANPKYLERKSSYIFFVCFSLYCLAICLSQCFYLPPKTLRSCGTLPTLLSSITSSICCTGNNPSTSNTSGPEL